jgi:hypothetical protein
MNALPASLMPAVAPALMLVMIAGVALGHHLERRIAPDASADDKLNAYASARLVAMAMQEGPALAVIAFSLVTGSPNWAIAAGAVGVWTMFLTRPKREDVERLLRG